MRIGWIGFHREGLLALRAVLEQRMPIAAVVTLAPELTAKKSGHADYEQLCREFDIPLRHVRHINDDESIALLESLHLDLAFVIGWTQIVGPRALRAAGLGMIGAHASLLPADRGRAPINWALIKGRPRTGNSLIWLADEVDTGDLIDQTVIPISPYDTCATLYDRVAESNRDMILRALPALLAGNRPGRPQGASPSPNLPGRRPEDGEIDWNWDAAAVYDFVRALTRPYPGAFGWLDPFDSPVDSRGESPGSLRARFLVWQCALLPEGLTVNVPAGTVIGSVVSPNEGACGQLVACGTGSVLLLEVEDADGGVLSGRVLSEQRWAGRAWRAAAAAGAGSGGASR
jgi:methionyl-tRNA formyltransferase